MTRFGLNWRAVTAEAFPDLFHPQKALVATSSFVDADPGSPWGQRGVMAHAQDWRAEFMRARACLFETATYETLHAPGLPLFEEGWRDVLEGLCIETPLREHETFQWVRIKQKFGIGRFDWVGKISDETRLRIVRSVDLAVACSREICASVGHLYNSCGLRAMRCTDHAAGAIRYPSRPAARTFAVTAAPWASRTCFTRATTERPIR